MKRYLFLLLFLFAVTSESFGQDATFNWASFPVEREIFSAATSGNYGTVGAFGGIGKIYFSPEKKVIVFSGMRTIEIPYLGQEPNDKYELKFESFTIVEMISIGKFEYAFFATNNGPFNRTVTGKIRFSIAKSGLFGIIEDFQMNEHGQTIKGVMNKYYLPKSEPAKAMLSKYEDIFFGGYYVVLEFAE